MVRYPETLHYSEAGKRELSKLAAERWRNARKAAEKLEGVTVEGKKLRVRQPRQLRPISHPNHMILSGNRDYVTMLRAACTEALRNGTHTLQSEDEDGDPTLTVIICNRKMGRKIGFQAKVVMEPPGSDA